MWPLVAGPLSIIRPSPAPLNAAQPSLTCFCCFFVETVLSPSRGHAHLGTTPLCCAFDPLKAPPVGPDLVEDPASRCASRSAVLPPSASLYLPPPDYASGFCSIGPLPPPPAPKECLPGIGSAHTRRPEFMNAGLWSQLGLHPYLPRPKRGPHLCAAATALLSACKFLAPAANDAKKWGRGTRMHCHV